MDVTTAYNGHFECTCYHPLFLFNQFGDLEWAILRRGNHHSAKFLRRLAVPKSVSHWTLTTLREKRIKIGAKVTRHSKYVTFQVAEAAVPRALFAAILERIKRLAMPPPSVAGAYV